MFQEFLEDLTKFKEQSQRIFDQVIEIPMFRYLLTSADIKR